MKMTSFTTFVAALGIFSAVAFSGDGPLKAIVLNELSLTLKSSDKGEITLPSEGACQGEPFVVDVDAVEGFVITQVATNGVPLSGAFGETNFTFTAVTDLPEMTIAAAYAPANAWFVDPFVRNNFISDISHENPRAIALDEKNDTMILGLAPGSDTVGVVKYSISDLVGDLRKETQPVLVDVKTGSRGGQYWARNIAVAPKYKSFISNIRPDAVEILVSPYEGPWTTEDGVGYAVPLSDLPNGINSLKITPITVNGDSTMLYGYVGDDGIICQFSIEADSDDATKIGAVRFNKIWDIGKNMVDDAICTATIGGKEFVYCINSQSKGTGLVYIDTEADEIHQTPIKSSTRSFSLQVVGETTENPRLVVSGKDVSIYDLNDDGSFVSYEPVVSFESSDFVLPNGSQYYANGFLDDEKRAIFASGTMVNNDPKISISVLECRPENLIVRGIIDGGKNIDTAIPYGDAAQATFKAPWSHEIASVTINGVPAEDFTQGTTYTFESSSLENYVLVEMTTVEVAPPAMNIVLNSSDRGTITIPYGDITGGTPFGVSVEAIEGFVITQVATNGVPLSGAFGETSFSFTANFNEESPCIAAAYARSDAWFLDPFVRNAFNPPVVNENTRTAALDEENGFLFVGLAPGNSSSGVVGYELAALTNDFGKITPYFVYDRESASRGGEYWGRSIAAVPRYKAFISCNSAVPNTTLVSPYEIGDLEKPWSSENGVGYSVPMLNLPEDKSSLKACPVAVNAEGTKFFTYTGKVVYQFAIVADPDDATKIGSMVFEKRFSTGDVVVNNAFDVAEFNRKEYLYCTGGSSAGLLRIDTDSGEILETGIRSSASAYAVRVIGQANGTPRLVVSSGRTDIYDLNDDGSFVSEIPVVSFATSDYVAMGYGDYYYANEFAKDERYAILASGGNSTQSIYITLLEKKPENLIVRGTFDDGETTDDRMVEFGGAASETFTAPKGFEISAVSVNGTAVADFVQAGSYTFDSDSLAKYTYVSMTLVEATGFAAEETISVGGVDVTLTDAEAAYLNEAMEESELSKADYVDALAKTTDNVSLATKVLLGTDPIKDTEYDFIVESINVETSVSIAIKLGRTDDDALVSTSINGKLKIYGAESLSQSFEEVDLTDASIVNGDFSGGTTATITFDPSGYNFFKAVIE